MTIQTHPSTKLIAPHFEQAVEIDNDMVALVRAIWARGWQTIAACQDVGEATEVERSLGPAIRESTGNAPFIEFYRGWAWLQMPRSDALALLNEVAASEQLGEYLRTRWERGSWRWQTPVIWTEDGFMSAPYIHVHFPKTQIEAVTEVVSKRRTS